MKPWIFTSLIAIAAAIALSGARPPRADAALLSLCANPEAFCSYELPVARKVELFEARARELRREIEDQIIPQILQQDEITSRTPSMRVRDHWRRIERSAMTRAHLTDAALAALVRATRAALTASLQSVPGLSEEERSLIYRRIHEIPISLPSRSFNPAQANRLCGRHGLDIQGYADGVGRDQREVVLCPGLLLLENLTPEHTAWVNGGLPSALQTVIAHELAHHFSDEPMPAQLGFKSCLVETLGLRGDDAALDEVTADFWASEALSHAISRGIMDQPTRRQAITLASLPMCVLDHLTVAEPDHFRALPRMTLSLSYHPRLRAQLDCPALTPARPTCDLEGSFPK